VHREEISVKGQLTGDFKVWQGAIDESSGEGEQGFYGEGSF